MLKKTDLAKQFDLVVQQEIKNYQNSLNFVLQSIKELKENINQVQQESLENHALIHSLQTDLSIEQENLKKFYSILNQSFLNLSSDQKTVNDKTLLQIDEINKSFYLKNNIDNNLKSKVESLTEEISKLKSKTENQYKILNDNLDDLLRRFRQEILKTKNEILDAPTEASAVKTHLEEKIETHRIDVAGIMRELNIYKRDNKVNEKKIENLYTLMQRSQSKIENLYTLIKG